MATSDELNRAATNLHRYILERDGCTITAFSFKEFKRENVIDGRIISENGKLKAFCRLFPKLFRWEDNQTAPGKGYVSAIPNGQDLPSSPPPLPSDLARERDRMKRILDRQDDENFDWGYNYLAHVSARLSGLRSTTSANYYDVIQKIRQLLSDKSEEFRRGIESETTILNCVVFKNSVYLDALCIFTLVCISDDALTMEMFNYLVRVAIPSGLLSVGGSILGVRNYPATPHTDTLRLISTLARYKRSNDDASTSATSDGADQSQPTTPITPSTEHCLAYAGPSPQTLQLPAVAPSNPRPFGELQYGLASVVVSVGKLDGLKDSLDGKFARLKMLVSRNSQLIIKSTAVGIFVFVQKPEYRIGSGGQAKVYIGGFIDNVDGAHSDADLDSDIVLDDELRELFDKRAQPVAIKRYNVSSDMEVHAFTSMKRNVAGIINYIDSFEIDDTFFIVQELGLISMEKALNEGGLLDDMDARLRIARAACLAVRELHEHKGGAILHRDIRLPNFLLTDQGLLKICDFGLSRVLPDNMTTLLMTSATPTNMWNLQPYEVQSSIRNAIAAADQRSTGEEVRGDNQAGIEGSTGSDIFMLGHVLYQIMLNRNALSNDQIMSRKEVDTREIASLFPGGELLASLIAAMMSHDRARRPTIQQVLEHPFFQSWEGNRSSVDALYRELYNANAPSKTEDFDLLCRILSPFEEKVNWSERFRSLPMTLKNNIKVPLQAPQVKDGTSLVPHPLPNLCLAVQWVRHFFTHYADPRTFDNIVVELTGVVGDKPTGLFLYVHDAVNWLLPMLWEARVVHMQQLKLRRDDLNRTLEEAKNVYATGVQEIQDQVIKIASVFRV